jgi:hypothetical protein
MLWPKPIDQNQRRGDAKISRAILNAARLCDFLDCLFEPRESSLPPQHFQCFK